MPLSSAIRSMVKLPVVITMMAASFLVYCSGDSGTGPAEENNTPTVLSISLAVSDALPGHEVEILGIPVNLDLSGVFAEVSDAVVTASMVTSGGTARTAAAATQAPVFRRDDGTPVLFAPLKPAEFINGGDVDIRLAGGNVTSNTVGLTISPLPLATVTVQDFVDQLQQLTTSWLIAHGTTRAALRAMDPASMPPTLIPLFVAQDVLDSPDNPNSLRATVDGPVPFFENAVFDFDITNRMLSTTDISSFFGEEINTVDSVNTANALRTETGTSGPASLRGTVATLTACLPADDFGINDAASLNAAMWKARFAINRLDGASGKVVSDVSSMVTALGVIPQLKGGATVVGSGLFVYKMLNDAVGSVLPSAFDNSATDFGFSGNKTIYNEDDTGGTWEKFKVTAVSNGWQLDKFVLKAVLKMAKFKDAGGLTFTAELSEFAKSLGSYGISEGTKFLIDEATDGGEFVEICPGVWPGIDVSNFLYSEAEVALGTSFVMTSHEFFETRKIGKSEIRVSTQSGQDVFGGAPPAIKQKEIEVIGIVVEVAPAAVQMLDDDVKTFVATVKNASNDQVAWTLPTGFQQVDLTNFGKMITIRSPDPFTQPASLQARSQAATGSRKGKVDSDPRDGFALITPFADGAIFVSPSGICVPLGKEQPFVATVTGLTNTAVTWSASVGTFVEGNVYKAPSSPVAVVTITATSVENPQVVGTATIEVSDCSCFWSLSVTGDVTGTWEGDFVLWHDQFYTLISGDDGVGGFPGFAFGPTESFIGTGEYTDGGGGNIGFGSSSIYLAGDDAEAGLTLPTIFITSMDDETIAGRISGRLCKPLSVEPFCSFIDFDLEFRAKHDMRGPGCQ